MGDDASPFEFERNIDLGTDHIEAAIASRESFRALLDRAALVSRPDEGGPKVLMACAALVRAGWLDGQLRVELEGDDDETRISILIDAGFRERVFPVVRMKVPLDEFARTMRLVPRLIVPLEVQERRGVHILKPKPAVRRPSARPTTRMAAVEADIYTRPTVVRMPAVHLPDDDDDDDDDNKKK